MNQKSKCHLWIPVFEQIWPIDTEILVYKIVRIKTWQKKKLEKHVMEGDIWLDEHS